jgi:hypothetical protein
MQLNNTCPNNPVVWGLFVFRSLLAHVKPICCPGLHCVCLPVQEDRDAGCHEEDELSSNMPCHTSFYCSINVNVWQQPRCGPAYQPHAHMPHKPQLQLFLQTYASTCQHLFHMLGNKPYNLLVPEKLVQRCNEAAWTACFIAVIT